MLTRNIILAALFLFTVHSFSAPMIQPDTANVDRGSILKKDLKDLHHIYKLTNTGDEDILIKRVKPGCGCTMVNYDSIIAPGKTGTIEIKIKKNKLGDGKFTKALRVISNAQNTPNLRLSISGKILSPIDLNKRFLRIESGEDNAEGEILLNTLKNDLAISEIKFVERQGNSPKWEKKPDLLASFNLSSTGKSNDFDYKEFKLNIKLEISPTNVMSGAFHIKTNHPEQEEIILRSMIIPPAKEGK